MLQRVDFNPAKKLLSREALDAYDPQSESWQKQFARRYTHHAELDGVLNNIENVNETVYKKFAIAITPYMAKLMDRDDPKCPIRLQYLPSHFEETKPGFATSLDQLGEEGDTVPGTSVVHRYPRRVLFLVSNTCATLCRFCTRKRMVSQPDGSVAKDEIEASIDYIAGNQDIEDVLLSGGDPLLMSEDRLDEVLGRIRAIPHIEFVRIGSRVPSFLPQRITPELVAVLRKHRVWLSLHFCHAREVTPDVANACDLLADGGIPLGSQTVLLKGVNDDVQTLKDLFHALLKVRVRPYYLYQCDPVVGTGHLRTSVAKGIELISGLRGHTTGYAVPTYVIDAPGGGGKVPIQAETIVSYENGQALLRNWAGRTYSYVDPAEHA